MAWNTTDRPGFPIGGEAMGLRNIVNMNSFIVMILIKIKYLF